MFSKNVCTFCKPWTITLNPPVGGKNTFALFQKQLLGQKRCYIKIGALQNLALSCHQEIWSILLFSAFLNCEFCDRYSSKIFFKVSNSYLREYLFVDLQSYVFFPELHFYGLFVSLFFFGSLFPYFSLFKMANVNVKKRYSSAPWWFPYCPCIFPFNYNLQKSFYYILYTVSSKIVAQGRGVFRTRPKIYEGAFLWKEFAAKTRNYFHKKAPSKIFDWVLNTPLQGLLQNFF